MIDGKKLIIILPAYNCEQTLRKTVDGIPLDYVDTIILTDDKSDDNTVALAEKLGLQTIRHTINLGYGANQKTCYKAALKNKADIIVMLHPDYQYTPKLLLPMAHMIASGLYDIVLGSRILGGGTLKGGMPIYKYVANRLLTFIQNILTSQKLSEFHTGYRAFSREALESLHIDSYSDNFIFDNQILCESFFRKLRIGELSCPTAYFKEASSIGLFASIRYGMGVLFESVLYFFTTFGLKLRTFYK